MVVKGQVDWKPPEERLVPTARSTRGQQTNSPLLLLFLLIASMTSGLVQLMRKTTTHPTSLITRGLDVESIFSKLLSLDFTLSGEELLSLPPVIGLIILKVHSPLHLNEEIGVVDVLAGHVVEHVGALVDGHVDISRLDLLDIGHDAPVYVHLFVVEIERVLGLQPEVPFLLVVPSPLLHVALVAIVQVEVRLVVHLGFLVPARVAISSRQLQEREAGEAGEALIQVSEH